MRHGTPEAKEAIKRITEYFAECLVKFSEQSATQNERSCFTIQDIAFAMDETMRCMASAWKESKEEAENER